MQNELSEGKKKVLLTISKNKNINSSEVAIKTGMSRAGVKKIVDKFVEEDIIRKKFSNKKHDYLLSLNNKRVYIKYEYINILKTALPLLAIFMAVSIISLIFIQTFALFIIIGALTILIPHSIYVSYKLITQGEIAEVQIIKKEETKQDKLLKSFSKK